MSEARTGGDPPADVRVEFERWGGFAGIPLRADVDTRSLPTEEAETVRRLVARADLASLPDPAPAGGGGADRFEYVLTVSEGDRRHTVRLPDGAVPESLRPLVDHLTRRAKRRPEPGAGPR